MATWTGRTKTWTYSLDVATVYEIRQRLGIDLLTHAGQQKVQLDVTTFVDVLGLILADDIQAAGMAPEDFVREFKGQAYQQAHEGFFAEMESFFLGLGRKDLGAALAKTREILALQVEVGAEKIAAVDLATPLRQEMAAIDLQAEVTGALRPPSAPLSTPGN